jgi:MFS family permease
MVGLPDKFPTSKKSVKMAAETAATEKVGIWATYREAPLAVKTILAGVLMSKLGGFLNIFIVLYLVSKGYSTERAALALSVYGAGAVAGILLGGTLAVRLGARNSTVISMSATAVLTVSLLYLPSYPLLLLAIVALSVAAQIYRPASATLLSELTPEGRQIMIFALYRFALNVGTTAAPLIGFTLYYLNHKTYLLLFWAEGLVALAYAVLAFAAIPARARPQVADGAADATTQAPSAGRGFRAVLRDRRYVLYLMANLFNAIIYMQYLSTLPLDVKASGVPIFWYTLAVSLNALVVISFELPLTKVVQRWPIRITVGLAFILVGIGMAAYGLPLGPIVIIGGTLIWTLGEIIGGPSVFAYPAMAGPANLKSSYIGSFQFVFALGTAIGPALGGVLFVHLGHKVWWVLAPISALAAVLGMVAVRAPTRQPKTAPDQEGTDDPVTVGGTK